MAADSATNNKVRLYITAMQITSNAGDMITRQMDFPYVGEDSAPVQQAWKSYLNDQTNLYNALYDDIEKVFGKKAENILKYTRRFDKPPQTFTELHFRSIQLQADIQRDGDMPLEYSKAIIFTDAEKHSVEDLLQIEFSRFSTSDAYEVCDVKGKKVSKALVDSALKKLLLMGFLKRSAQGRYTFLSRNLAGILEI